jgi:hypothetical protein
LLREIKSFVFSVGEFGYVRNKIFYLLPASVQTILIGKNFRQIPRFYKLGCYYLLMQNTSTLSHQPHPFGHYIPDTAKTLIIGTFPPPEHRWAFRFFYPNKTNLMWQILFKLAKAEDRQEDAVDLRKEVLKKLRVGITDMGHTIQRKSKNAYDENLDLENAMNILELHKKKH